jgi:hypothetical protein
MGVSCINKTQWEAKLCVEESYSLLGPLYFKERLIGIGIIGNENLLVRIIRVDIGTMDLLLRFLGLGFTGFNLHLEPYYLHMILVTLTAKENPRRTLSIVFFEYHKGFHKDSCHYKDTS